MRRNARVFLLQRVSPLQLGRRIRALGLDFLLRQLLGVGGDALHLSASLLHVALDGVVLQLLYQVLPQVRG